TANAPETRAPQDLPIQRHPRYKNAVALFQKGDYSGAKACVEALLAAKSISSRERDFLTRQLSVCNQKLRLPSPSGRGAGGGGGNHSLWRVSPNPAAPLGDCGPRALKSVMRKLGLEVGADELARAAGTTQLGTTLDGLVKAAAKHGLKAEGIQVNLAALKEL